MPHKSEKGWKEEYAKRQAYWEHSGDPRQAHVVLRSLLHSTGFFNSRPVIADVETLREAAEDLVEKLRAFGNFDHVNRIVGPQTGATKLAELISIAMGCSWASPAKCVIDGADAMTFEGESQAPQRGELTILCEDVFTTGKSVGLTARAVEGCRAEVLTVVLVIVNRSGLTEVNGRKIISLIDMPVQTWEPNECPLCAAGSLAITSPKDNWGKLAPPPK